MSSLLCVWSFSLFSSSCKAWGSSPVAVHGWPLQWLCVFLERDLLGTRLQQLQLAVLGRVGSQELWPTSLAVVCVSSCTKDWNCVPCTGRWTSQPLDHLGGPLESYYSCWLSPEGKFFRGTEGSQGLPRSCPTVDSLSSVCCLWVWDASGLLCSSLGKNLTNFRKSFLLHLYWIPFSLSPESCISILFALYLIIYVIDSSVSYFLSLW